MWLEDVEPTDPPEHYGASQQPKQLLGQTHVAAEPTPSPPGITSLPANRPLTWALATGILIISVAGVSFAKNLFKASKKLSHHTRNTESSTPLSSVEAAAVGAIAPMLIAGETAGAVDETAHLSQEELNALDLNIRMLITNMDSHLSEYQDEIASFGLPSIAVEALESITTEVSILEEQLGTTTTTTTTTTTVVKGSTEADAIEEKLNSLQWEVFAVLQQHANDDAKRSYRSLLYNRGVQAQLLRQVERQLLLREQINSSNKTTLESGGRVEQVKLAIAGCSIPHLLKASTGGEDAFFTNNDCGYFAVADGVGGWAALGVDPAEYPRKLIAACEAAIDTHSSTPLALLQHAYDTTHAPGSCTIALAALQQHSSAAGGMPSLHIASLGDCGVRVIRDGSIVFSSEVQEHRFNQPYQLGSPQHHPEGTMSEPEDCFVYDVAVQRGDTVILASDGLFDNLFDSELEAVVAEQQSSSSSSSSGDTTHSEYQRNDKEGVMLIERAQALAEKLAAAAAENSTSTTYVSPFAKEKHERTVPEELKAVVRQPRGGKPDDVTVVAAFVY